MCALMSLTHASHPMSGRGVLTIPYNMLNTSVFAAYLVFDQSVAPYVAIP